MPSSDPLPSWRQGTTRQAILDFLDQADDIPVERRVAVFDNDGTLWCEKPVYVQLDFFVRELRRAVADRPDLAERPEYRAILDGDRAALGRLGLERVAVALTELFAGLRPEEFDERARAFVTSARHQDFGVPYDRTVYEPMIELLTAIRSRGFATFVVTGGGTEFVRAVSRQLYGVDPEGVVGTLITYELVRRGGEPVLIRTGRPSGDANEGPAKIANIQHHLGRRPILAAGNSAGDRDMLEYATAVDGPSLALLVDHDDSEREYSYASEAGTFVSAEPIRDVAQRLGWSVVSMRSDWAQVFPSS